ncbi:hypothetical protein [Paraliomyxa miuraensis]|uniref:hypothetical protein n=1 Tax=Paraliomyxa miuraensis TaxID=376150 RepID=UPI00225932E5|nr:hypothetical protein [Paraliomyxa miuraensis]MCX4248097.1 hypothetical protein [Paraliomyxa miuraensis]
MNDAKTNVSTPAIDPRHDDQQLIRAIMKARSKVGTTPSAVPCGCVYCDICRMG